MKELLKQAFQAGRDFGHAMGTGRPTHGLTFDEWYSENENQALSLGVVSESFSKDDLLDLGGWFDGSPEFVEEVVNDWLNAR